MVVAARRDERGLIAVELRHLETEDAAIKIERALQVGHFEVDVANRDARMDRTLMLRPSVIRLALLASLMLTGASATNLIYSGNDPYRFFRYLDECRSQ